jgi:hypothetical protein
MVGMMIVTDFGPANTGLSVKVSIWDAVTSVQKVNQASMEAIGGGAYRYHFEGFLPQSTYFVVCDGGATLSGDDRYNSDVVAASW